MLGLIDSKTGKPIKSLEGVTMIAYLRHGTIGFCQRAEPLTAKYFGSLDNKCLIGSMKRDTAVHIAHLVGGILGFVPEVTRDAEKEHGFINFQFITPEAAAE